MLCNIVRSAAKVWQQFLDIDLQSSRNSQLMKKVRTPCLGICSATSLGDPTCRGCKRYAFEVIRWNVYDDEQKLAVLRRIEKLIGQIIQHKMQIDSEQKLREGLKASKVPFDEKLSPFCWLHNLLKRRQDLECLAEFGVSVKEDYSQLSITALSELIDQEILTLSQAHFARYLDETRLVANTAQPS